MKTMAIVLSLITLLAAVPATATNFCGENGVVRLSFTPGPDLQPVLESAEGEKGAQSDQINWPAATAPGQRHRKGLPVS